MSAAHEELFRLIAGRTATTAVNAIIAAGYVKAEAGVPEMEWGTSPFEDGFGMTKAVDEESAEWRREQRGSFVFKRPVPAEWELVQP